MKQIDPVRKVPGKTPIEGLIQQLREVVNPVTRSVLIDCVVDRLKRYDFQ